MRQRIFSAFFGIILFVIVLLVPKNLFDVAVLIITELGIYEMLSALGMSKHKGLILLNMLFPIAFFANVYYFHLSQITVLFIFLAITLTVMMLNHKELPFSAVAQCFTTTVLITVAFMYVSFTRRMENGIANVLLVFFGSWITDTCAYFVGVAFGKHKLIPEISPKKTIEGSIGGIFGVSIIMLAYSIIAANIINTVNVSIVSVLSLGLICGAVSQLGDLCASAIKREYGIKDYGNLMPGHGGVLDRFDSVIFVAPTVYLFLQYFPVFIG